jgi:hypothetical protein
VNCRSQKRDFIICNRRWDYNFESDLENSNNAVLSERKIEKSSKNKNQKKASFELQGSSVFFDRTSKRAS